MLGLLSTSFYILYADVGIGSKNITKAVFSLSCFECECNGEIPLSFEEVSPN